MAEYLGSVTGGFAGFILGGFYRASIGSGASTGSAEVSARCAKATIANL